MKTLKKLLLAFLFLFLSLLLVAMGYYFLVTKDVTLDEEKLLLPEVQLCAYDHRGERIATGFGFSTRETVDVDELSPHTKNAFVCLEDKRFFSHDGFDYRRIVKAALNNLKASSFKEGASTISQQLIKNTHLSLEKTFSRKLKEVKLTIELERKYSKNEILCMYLNTVYFGHSCYGVQSAARFYFDKPAAELSVAEAAALAGLLRAPNHYSPFKNPEKCLSRRAVVLRLMQEQGAITPAEYERAQQEPLPTPTQRAGDGHAYLRFAVEELEEILSRREILPSGKIELYTYADLDLQKMAERLASEVNCDAAIALLDNETRGFKVFYSTLRELRRPPASTVKPLAVYAPAFELGVLSPATLLLDEPINYAGYTPKNYDEKYRGYVSARDALKDSLNIPAVKTLDAVGVKTASAYLTKLNLAAEEGDETLALALGGMKKGFTLSNLVSAYSVFPCDGKYQSGAFLRKIVVNGHTVYERKEESRAVFTPETAYLITDVLQTAVKSGTAKKLRSLPFPIAAKTGTAGTQKGNTDAYVLSYTPCDTVGVWLGKADNSPIPYTGGGEPCEIAAKLHEQVVKLRGYAAEFERPYRVKEVLLDGYAYQRDKTLLRADPAAPAEYTFKELFAEKYLPQKNSTIFSSPTILAPKIELLKGIVKISLPKSAPEFYEYEVRRRWQGAEKLLYRGKLNGEFIDRETPLEGICEYSLTPYYQNKQGERLRLPAVILKGEETPPSIPKDWWRK